LTLPARGAPASVTEAGISTSPRVRPPRRAGATVRSAASQLDRGARSVAKAFAGRMSRARRKRSSPRWQRAVASRANGAFNAAPPDAAAGRLLRLGQALRDLAEQCHLPCEGIAAGGAHHTEVVHNG